MAKYKVALDAGHGKHTAGKRTPDGEREWTFNNTVLLAAKDELSNYPDIEVIRLDDPTGERDVPLRERTNKAKAEKADVLASIHHNANTGKYGTWTGTETFVQETFAQNPKSHALAKAVHPKYVKAFGLKDRGIKTNNFHMLRETNYYENGVQKGMAAILTEGGYMDSSIDIAHLRSNTRLKAQGKAIAEGIAEYLGAKRTSVTVKVETSIKPKEDVKVASVDAEKNASADRSFVSAQEFVKAKGISDGTYPRRTMTRQEAFAMMERLYNAIKQGK